MQSSEKPRKLTKAGIPRKVRSDFGIKRTNFGSSAEEKKYQPPTISTTCWGTPRKRFKSGTKYYPEKYPTIFPLELKNTDLGDIIKQGLIARAKSCKELAKFLNISPNSLYMKLSKTVKCTSISLKDLEVILSFLDARITIDSKIYILTLK